MVHGARIPDPTISQRFWSSWDFLGQKISKKNRTSIPSSNCCCHKKIITRQFFVCDPFGMLKWPFQGLLVTSNNRGLKGRVLPLLLKILTAVVPGSNGTTSYEACLWIDVGRDLGNSFRGPTSHLQGSFVMCWCFGNQKNTRGWETKGGENSLGQLANFDTFGGFTYVVGRRKSIGWVRRVIWSPGQILATKPPCWEFTQMDPNGGFWNPQKKMPETLQV